MRRAGGGPCSDWDNVWHKSSSFKLGAPAFSVVRDTGPPGFVNRAAERNTKLTFISPSKILSINKRVLVAPVQKLNFFIALQLVGKFLQLKNPDFASNADDIPRGVDGFSWPGVIDKGNLNWFLDNAPNPLSLEQVAEWFAKKVHATGSPNSVLSY